MAEHVDSMNDLPKTKTFITGHDKSTGKSIIEATHPAAWVPLTENAIGFNVLYTTSVSPPSLANDEDLKAHNQLLASKKLGLVNSAGTVVRMVDFSPGLPALMHRTLSLDYGIVLEGSIEMVLDSGVVELMHRGDVAIQRATMHGWRNPSMTDWARMIFVLQDCEPFKVNGEAVKEDLGAASKEILGSGNDAE